MKKTITRLRRRLARLLVGPFVQVPDRDGVWLVMRAGAATVTWETEQFRLDAGTRWDVSTSSSASFPVARRWGDFEGTVKQP